MKRTYLVRALLVGLVIGLALAPRSAYAATPIRTCTVTDLGTLPGGSFSLATSINDVGQAVGTADDISGTQHAVLWDKGAIHDLGTLPGESIGQVTAINNWGQVVGNTIDISGTPHAVLWDKAGIHNLGTLPGGFFSQATAINNWGQVVGTADISGTRHAVLWDKGAIHDLGTLPGGSNSLATAINDVGQVVGTAHDISGTQHAVLWDKAGIHNLGTLLGGLLGSWQDATGINNWGEVVGDTGQPYFTGVVGIATLWIRGHAFPLFPLPGDTITTPISINNRGQILGVSGVLSILASPPSHTVLWDKSGVTLLNLDPLPGGSVEGNVVQGFNDWTQIVGGASTANGGGHAVVWHC